MPRRRRIRGVETVAPKSMVLRCEVKNCAYTTRNWETGSGLHNQGMEALEVNDPEYTMEVADVPSQLCGRIDSA